MAVVLVTSATGNVGQAGIPLLLRDPATKVVALSSDHSRLQKTFGDSPHEERIFFEAGDVANPQWVSEIIKKHQVTSALVNFFGTNELITSLNVIDVVRKAGVGQLVFLSVAGPVDRAYSAAHMAVKLPLERNIARKDNPFKWTVLGPALFFANDERDFDWTNENGIYAAPHGDIGASRVDTKDIAEVWAKVVSDPDRYHGRKINIGSRHAYTDADIARIWTRALGKPISSPPVDQARLDVVEKRWIGKADPTWARDMVLMYEGFREFGFHLTEQDSEELVEILGREAASYEAFVEELVKRRTKSA